MNPKNPKNQNKPKKKKKKSERERKKSETHHNLYLCDKKRGGEKMHTSKGSAESSATKCTSSERIAEKSWKRRSLEQ